MIENIWILTKGGILLYNKNYVHLYTESDLLAGFLSAMDSFIKETTKGEIKCIVLKGKKFSYTIATDNNLMFVLTTVEHDNNVLIQKMLNKIKLRFIERFPENFINFTGETNQFKDFDRDLEKIILNSEIFIKCQTCKKIILDEFRIKQIGDMKVFFCCMMCEKYFSYDDHIEKKKRLSMEKMHLYCPYCEHVKPLPIHCNKPMHYEVIKGNNKLVCWMGAECKTTDIPKHCGVPMMVKN